MTQKAIFFQILSKTCLIFAKIFGRNLNVKKQFQEGPTFQENRTEEKEKETHKPFQHFTENYKKIHKY